jgi:hypothetical protein
LAWIARGAAVVMVPGYALGNDGSRWPVDKECAWLSARDVQLVRDAREGLEAIPEKAIELELGESSGGPVKRVPLERDFGGGFWIMQGVPEGTYQVAVSAAATITVVQNEKDVPAPSLASTTGCWRIARLARFELTAGPVRIFITKRASDKGPNDKIRVTIRRVDG